MRLEFEVELPDSPGELNRILDIVARHGANVQSVIHRHEREEDGRVPVAVTVEIGESDALRLLDALARTHRLLRVNREGGPARTALVLVGHVFEADLRELLDRAFENRAEVGTIDARVQGRANPSAVLVTLSADDETTLAEAVTALRHDATENDLMVIEQVPGEADV